MNDKNRLLSMIIFQEKCIKCGTCANACGACVLEMTPEAVQEKYPELCIKCGHCIAVCPTGAIQLSDLKEEPILSEKTSITFEQFLKLAQNRRSIRNFKPQPIPKEVLEKLINSAKYAPTGRNSQELQYLVISDPERLKVISSLMAKYFVSKKTKIINRVMFAKKKAKTLNFVMKLRSDKYFQGKDFFLHGAPALIIIYVKKQKDLSNMLFGFLRSIDVGIAGHHLSLACETLGLSSCWIGLHAIICRLFKTVRTASMIPAGHKAVGALVVGYPNIKYHKTCVRKQPSITWVADNNL